MYRIPFSAQWQLDRCIEAETAASFFYKQPLVTMTLLVLMTYGALEMMRRNDPATEEFFQRLTPSLLKQLPQKLITGVTSLLIGAVLTIPVLIGILFGSIIIGMFLLNCNMGPLWDGVEPGHELHDSLKHAIERGETSSDTAALQDLNPAAMRDIQSNAAIRYAYNHEEDTYLLLVQPSRYYIAAFSSAHGYSMHRGNVPWGIHMNTVENTVTKEGEFN